MTQSLKNTWITIFSIFAMLMSNYVSSAPAMTLNNILAANVTMTSTELPSHHTAHHAKSPELAVEHHAKHTGTHCHSMNDNISIEEPTAKASAKMTHCGDSSSSVDNCCTSVCSGVSYPTDAPYSLIPFSSSLALHQSVIIGDKVTRIQHLLRPPSA